MELPHIFKRSKKDGFTLIEMLLVLVIVAIIAIVSVSFGLPALSQFSCRQEAQVVRIALERARHISQVGQKGNVRFEITSQKYEIYEEQSDGLSVRIDEFNRRSLIPVSTHDEIIFLENSGSLSIESAGIQVGDTSAGCQETIHLNNVGTLL